ncbi:MAG: thiamine pyrophosphate-dependent dehydrogenase E1 component subunit alpha [Rhizobiales bacterium]|nr:thiamine pyrophosphate-dependent dehydrogenase E1 component subunit alpha [Hyphomicrobiales bacterium]
MSELQLSQAQLLEAYRLMKTIRVFEERAMTEKMGGNVPGGTHLYAGEEASAVGVCMHLGPADQISSTHRGHGHSIAKGCDVDGMMAEIMGKGTGICGGKGGSQHIADLSKGMLGANGIVGAGSPIVCGAALSAQILGKQDVAVAFIGDGAFNQGTTAESLNLASIWKLPAIFVVEDNGFGEATSSAFVQAGEIVERAASFKIPAMKVDGVDFFAVYQAAGEAVSRARAGGGPSVIHTVVPRYFGHYAGDPDNYRTAEEKAAMRKDRDCLKRFRARVDETSLLDAAALDQIDADVEAAIASAADKGRAAPPPALESLTTDVYIRYV